MDQNTALFQATTDLCAAVDGVDWNAEATQEANNRFLKAARASDAAGRAAALEIIVRRLQRSRLDDADGVAHVAIAGGTLVEMGTDARQLGRALLGKAPDLLEAARRYADLCLRELGDDEEEPDEPLLFVDERGISHDVFRIHIQEDRPAGVALAYLERWMLPLIAALTRDRELLVEAQRNERLVAAALRMRGGDAMWLHRLLQGQVDAIWLVVCPLEERAFEIVLDGVTTNFDLFPLIEHVVVGEGIPGGRNPSDVIAFIRGDAKTCSQQFVSCFHSFFTWRAAASDLRQPGKVDMNDWVWSEGIPSDVPFFAERRTILVGPPAYQNKTWNLGRPFRALAPKATLARELPKSEAQALLRRLVRR